MAQTYGVVAPHSMGVARTLRVLADADVRLLGAPIADWEIRDANEEIIRAGIGLRPDARSGVRAATGWALALAVEAEREGRLRDILEAFDTTRSLRSPEPYSYEMLVRCHVIGGDFDSLDELTGGELEPEEWSFLAAPTAHGVFDSLPARYLESALGGCLEHVTDTAAPAEAVIEACWRLSAQVEAHIGAIAFVRILQGRFDAAQAEFDRLPPAARDRRAARTALAATRALIAMLRGDDVAANGHIEAAIDAEKAGTRKRNVFPNHAAFALSLVALVRTDSPESHALLQQLLRTADRLHVERHVELGFVVDAARVRGGQAIYARRADAPGLEILLDGLRGCWVESHDRGDRGDRVWQRQWEAYRDRALASGFDWVVAECASIRLAQAGARAAGGADPALLHGAIGSRSLTVLAEREEDWERSLKALERLAYDARSRQESKRTGPSTVERRLVWDVVATSGDVRLSPREQRRNKNGSWSKGRKVSLKRLTSEAVSMDFLREEDRAAAAAIGVYRTWSGVEHVLDVRGVHALAGHPNIVGEEGQRIDIVRREPELGIEEGEDIASVWIEPYYWDSEDEYEITLVTANRIEVTRFLEHHRRLADILGPEGLEVPAGSRARLLEAIWALVPEMRVHGVAGAVTSAAQVEADGQPWVRLEPFEAGLSVALLVEPVPDSGVFFEPGRGGTTVLASVDSRNVQAQRDLESEAAAMTRLVDACPRLTGRPTEVAPLALPEAVSSLELLEQLDAAGARCKWPKGEPLRIVARRSTPSLSLTVRSADQWLQASGTLELGDGDTVDLKGLLELLDASPGSRFLQLDSGAFVALTSAFRRQLDDLAALSTPAAGGGVRFHPLAARAMEDLLEGADFGGEQDWHGPSASPDDFEPELPSTLQAELRPYQVDGYRWLARLSRWGAGACLADDMGLGKTVQTLALLLDRAPGGPALVVAPTSVVANWADEARRFAPTLRVRAYSGVAAARAPLLDDPSPFDLYLTTYGVLQNDAERLASVQWNSLVLDEAQAIKNPATKRAIAARRLGADFRLVTTGTPIQNNLMDLYSLFSFLNPGLLGSREKFRSNFGEPIEVDGDDEARSRLRRFIAPFVLRRLKADVLDDLPARTEVTLHVELSPAEAALYEELRRRAVAQLEADRQGPRSGHDGRFELFAHLTRLRLACCNAKLVLDGAGDAPASSKLATFAGVLDGLLAGRHKVLVFSQFVTHLKLVEEYLGQRGIAYQYLDGSTPAKARSERVAAFQAGAGEVFLISLKAGGTGLNLTAADYVIHMDPWWNPAVEDQASDRAHRIGQTRPVTIYRLVTEGTIEEQIVDLHHRKRELADGLLEGTEAAGRMNTEELLALLKRPLAYPQGSGA